MIYTVYHLYKWYYSSYLIQWQHDTFWWWHWYTDQSVHPKTLPCHSLTLTASHLGPIRIFYNSMQTNVRVISRKHQINLSLGSQLPLQIYGIAMKRVDNYKYLGVWITSNLSWSKHISEVCRKARQKVGILYRKCYKNANNATMLNLSGIRPELEYAATVWSHLKGQIDTLNWICSETCNVSITIYLALHE